MEAIVEQAIELLDQANVVVPKGAVMEIYHHLGMERVRDYGAIIITCFNRDYCKKYIVLLPNQTLPVHAHKIKEETFTLLYGDVEGMSIGETLLIEPVTPHSLTSRNGAVLEEISTKYLEGDSRYADSRINGNPNRKTWVKSW